MAQTFTDENVHDIIATGQPVVVDFWATWCGPCVAMAPTIDKIAGDYEGRVVVGKYNMDEQNDLAVECRVMALPTILFFKDGKKTSLRLAGSQSYDAIKDKIEELLKL
ncbi:MAG: thioredoxin [Muribaculaceae bacterium]|nr:thioredoxin [Muribaculaceae bacterium]